MLARGYRQAHEELDKAQGKLRQEQRVGSNFLQSACMQVGEAM